MRNVDRYHFGEVNALREETAILAIVQPVTAKQLARTTGASLDNCSKRLHRLRAKGIVVCLNPAAQRNRLFWLTLRGIARFKELSGDSHQLGAVKDIDWGLYASVCFSHRSEVIKSLSHAMQPSQIKRRAIFRNPRCRISANNVRDVIRYFKSTGIVRSVAQEKRRHPRYELTDVGQEMRRLLTRVEVRI